MDLEVVLPLNAEKISPIFITAPVNLSGGAMLQRAFCTGENSICFGDNLFDEVLSLIDWSVGLINRHKDQQDWEKETLELAISRKPLKWMPELAPPSNIYRASLFSVIYNLPYTAQSYAEENSREIWGMARAGVPLPRMNDLASIFPKSKSIFIYRNPLSIVEDTLRDRPDTNVREVCDAWNTSMRDFLSYSSDKLLKLRYEDSFEDTSGMIGKIEGFTGAKGLDHDVMSVGSEAETDSDYTLSSDLSDLIKNQCSDMLAVYYPDLINEE